MIVRLTDDRGKRQSFYVEPLQLPPVYLMRFGQLWAYQDHAILPDPRHKEVTAFYRAATVYDISHIHPMEE